MKKKLQLEGSELSEKIGQLKMKAEDGKMRLTDVADMEQLLRSIQSIPLPKAEPFQPTQKEYDIITTSRADLEEQIQKNESTRQI